jgi:hypothetical protein
LPPLPGNRRAEQDAFLPAAASTLCARRSLSSGSRAIGMGNPVDKGPSCLWRGVRRGRAEGVRWSPGKGVQRGGGHRGLAAAVRSDVECFRGWAF